MLSNADAKQCSCLAILRLTNFKLERFLLRLRDSRNFDLKGNFTTFILVVIVVLVLEGIT